MAQTLAAQVKHGSAAGTRMVPHRYADGTYVASPTRFKVDQVHVGSIEALIDCWQQGYGIRMSNGLGGAPSLFAARSIALVSA